MRSRLGYAFLSAAILAGCSSKTPVPGITGERTNAEWFVLLPVEGMPQAVLEGVANAFQEWIVVRATAGDRVHVLAGSEHLPLASFVIPEVAEEERLRDRELLGALAQIIPYFTRQESPTSPQVQLPRLQSTVQALRRTDFPCRVVVIGDPAFDDARNQGWSMLQPAVPSDGALKDELSPFYIRDQFPAGTEVTWVTPGQGWGVDDAHRHAVARFIRLFLQEQGARLVRITPEGSAAFDFANGRHELTETRSSDPSGMKPTSAVGVRSGSVAGDKMIEVPILPWPQESVPVTPDTEDQLPGGSGTNEVAPPHPVQVGPSSASNTHRNPEIDQILNKATSDLEGIAIAILWESADPNCDVDLWITGKKAGGDLYYGNQRTSFGEYFRDVRNSSTAELAYDNPGKWEWARVDASRSKELVVWINVYRTDKPIKLHTICVRDGKRRDRRISIETSIGDRGKGRTQRQQNPAWLSMELDAF